MHQLLRMAKRVCIDPLKDIRFLCAVILAGTFGNEPEKFDAAAEKYLADYPFLKSAAKAAVQDYKKNKRLRKVIEE